MTDDSVIVRLMVRSYLKGIGDGVDLVFSSLKEVGCKTFDLKDADHYRELVKTEIARKTLCEDLEKRVQ